MNKTGQRTKDLPEKTSKATEGDQLESLNAQLRRPRAGAGAIRRRMEAQIDAKAKERREREPDASASLGSAIDKG